MNDWGLFLDWVVSEHGETGIHPSVGDVWADGGVLEETADHASLWGELSERDTGLVLEVPAGGEVLED